MKRVLGLLLALGVVFTGVSAQNVTLNPDHPDSYVVVVGDTLWDISARFLSYPWEWPEIWEVNPQIENPHLIYPGDVISLSYRDGRPVLGLSRGRNVKLSPSIRSYPRDQAIAPIPLDAIQQFLSRPLVVSASELETAPYVVANEEARLIAGSDNRTYVRGLVDPQTNKYSVYRQGAVYRDPDNNDEVIGYEALHIGDVIFERAGDPATALIVNSNREILVGDRLMPQTRDEYLEFIPHAPTGSVNGAIISVVDGVSQIGQFQVVVLNLGRTDGIEPGHVLAIHQSGRIVTDRVANQSIAGMDGRNRGRNAYGGESVQLPEERAGELMVFRTFNSVSYALVMNTQRAVHVRDRVRNP